MTNVRVFLTQITRAVWFRASLFSLAAVLLALAAGFLEPLLPDLAVNLGQGSVDEILQIVASSMLAVTTFSLTAMVTAYGSASRVATPRATQLLVADPTSQNVLSTFIGAFVFSMVGIIAISTGYYGDQGQAILFAGTLVVIVIVVVVLLRWISHLGSFGRMSDIIDRVESAAQRTTSQYANRPSLGARRQDPRTVTGASVRPERAGYVTHIDLGRLEAVAEARELTIHVRALPGTVVDAASPLALVAGTVDEEVRSKVANAFHIESHRSYDQDPRLGMIALSEIASRALSPSTNDPGTAIDVLAALSRVFENMLQTEADDDTPYGHVTVEPVTLGDLVEDAFRPIARDGAGVVEVGIRLQKTLASLADLAGPARGRPFTDAATDARARAQRVLSRSDAVALRRAASAAPRR